MDNTQAEKIFRGSIIANEMYIAILEKLIAQVQETVASDETDENKVARIQEIINPYIEIRSKGKHE